MASQYSQVRKDVRGSAGSTSFSGVKPSVMLYLGLTCIALLKDLLDFAGIGSLPGIGFVVTACFSFFIWMLLTLFDRSGGKQNKKMIQGLVIVFLGLVEGVAFGLNFLPIETLTVIILYQLARRSWKAEEKRLREEAHGKNRAEEARTRQMQAQAASEAEGAGAPE